MSPPDHGETAMLLLAAATQIVDRIQDGVARRGYDDVRPMHGFAFVRISAGDATVIDVADHLGITKQAASQLVEQLVQRGYVTRTQDPWDARRRPLALTRRGRACTRAAQAAAADAVVQWTTELGVAGLRSLHALLGKIGTDGPLRPTW